MNISEKKAFIKEYFEHIADHKEKITYQKKHELLRARDGVQQRKTLEDRKLTLKMHEDERSLNKAARQLEVEKRQTFLNHGTALNII